MGKFIHLSIGCGLRLFSFNVFELHFTIPLVSHFLIIFSKGAFMISGVVGILWECPLLFLNLFISPFTLDILWSSVPRKYALSFAAFVIRVFSGDRSSFSVSFKNSLITCLSTRACSMLPIRPINQSSAYLT